MNKRNSYIAHAVAAATLAAGFAGSAAAQSNEDLKQQIDSLQRQIDQLKSALERQQAAPAAAPAGTQAVRSPARSNGYVELYGHLDVSLDDASKGIAGKSQGGSTASGHLGWQPDLSSNLSRLGVRGARNLGDTGLRAIFQIETQVDVTATPGESTVPDNTIKGAWASRNSYIGFAGGFGAIKAGKSDAPYKLSTGRMDPFSATVGDYNSIIGNTGGDNRAEFDTRFSHALWYESPKFGAFRVNAFWSPSQNRSTDNIGTPSGEPDCAGGNQPPCNDGSNGNVYSIAGIFDSGPLYVIGAYEMHRDVNRTGDEAAGGGPAPLGSIGVRDEYAYKVGIQYKLPTRTTLNGIWERMVRNDANDTFNERKRTSYYFSVVQKFSPMDDLNLAWAHAGKTPGDPAFGSVNNESNLYAVGWKHHFDRQTTVYAVYATQKNHNFAHFDLGASGHGITTDCHDENGVCFFGGNVQAVSIGATYDF